MWIGFKHICSKRGNLNSMLGVRLLFIEWKLSRKGDTFWVLISLTSSKVFLTISVLLGPLQNVEEKIRKEMLMLVGDLKL